MKERKNKNKLKEKNTKKLKIYFFNRKPHTQNTRKKKNPNNPTIKPSTFPQGYNPYRTGCLQTNSTSQHLSNRNTVELTHKPAPNYNPHFKLFPKHF